MRSMRNDFKEKFERDSQWIDKMIKVVFYTVFVIIVLGMVASIVGGAVIIRVLQNLGLL